MSRSDHAREVRHALHDPWKLCGALGLLEGAKRQATGVSICCPSHGESRPSLSVTRGPDGTVRARCFGCDFMGDALTLIALVHGLSLSSDFRDVLALGAELGGNLTLREEILGGQPMPDRKRVPAPPPQAPAEYPDRAEVDALWSAGVAVSEDADVWEYLRGRAIDPEKVDRAGVARALPDDAPLPSWARYGASDWRETGHRILLPLFDAQGDMRAVRAWRIQDGDTPKRLPPAKRRSGGLVLANRGARMMLAGYACPLRLLFVEGEPDFVNASTEWADSVIGVGSGWWTEAHADRVPRRTEVVLMTHNDEAGDRYAAQIAETLPRNPMWRAAA